MLPAQIETILTFYMSKLSESELAELDGLLEGGTPDSSMAQDSQRDAWLRLGSSGRNTVRQNRQARVAQDSAGAERRAKMFPNMNRLK